MQSGQAKQDTSAERKQPETETETDADPELAEAQAACALAEAEGFRDTREFVIRGKMCAALRSLLLQDSKSRSFKENAKDDDLIVPPEKQAGDDAPKGVARKTSSRLSHRLKPRHFACPRTCEFCFKPSNMNVYYTCECDGRSGRGDCPLLNEFRVLCGRCAFGPRAWRCCESCDRVVPASEADRQIVVVFFKEELEDKLKVETHGEQTRLGFPF